MFWDFPLGQSPPQFPRYLWSGLAGQYCQDLERRVTVGRRVYAYPRYYQSEQDDAAGEEEWRRYEDGLPAHRGHLLDWGRCSRSLMRVSRLAVGQYQCGPRLGQCGDTSADNIIDEEYVQNMYNRFGPQIAEQRRSDALSIRKSRL